MQINSVVNLIVTKADFDRDPVSFTNKCNEEANNYTKTDETAFYQLSYRGTILVVSTNGQANLLWYHSACLCHYPQKK